MAKKAATDDVPDSQKMTKAEAVRQALAAGVDKPKEGVVWIKEKLGIDITTSGFSVQKNNEKKKGGSSHEGKRRGRKPGSKNKPKAVGGIEIANGRTVEGGARTIRNGVELAKDVKRLVDEYGAEAVKGMADVFAG